MSSDLTRGWKHVDRDGVPHDDCPGCIDYEDTLKQAEKQLRIANARITRMERDAEHQARRHKLWDEAEAAHNWWALACGHEGVKFGAEEFGYIVPRLKEKDVGIVGVLQAIAGAAFDPGTKTRKNGTLERFDSLELVCRNRLKFNSFQERAPGWPTDKHKWKRWLIEHIESTLKEEK